MSMYGKKRVFVDCSNDPGLTKQEFADEVNINKIIASFDKTGMIRHLNNGEPWYGDVSEISDYQEALNTVHEAETLFMSMSAEVRSRFANDPALMIEFLNNPANYDEAVKLGMVTAKPVPPRKQEDDVNEKEMARAAAKQHKGKKSSEDEE